MKKTVFFLLLCVSTYCYSQVEISKTLWESLFDKYVLENGEQNVFYTTVDYIDENNKLIKVLFIYNPSNSYGIIVYSNSESLVNYYEVTYSNDNYTLNIISDLSGGLSAWIKAEAIMDIIMDSTLHIGICKDLIQLILPDYEELSKNKIDIYGIINDDIVEIANINNELLDYTDNTVARISGKTKLCLLILIPLITSVVFFALKKSRYGTIDTRRDSEH